MKAFLEKEKEIKVSLAECLRFLQFAPFLFFWALWACFWAVIFFCQVVLLYLNFSPHSHLRPFRTHSAAAMPHSGDGQELSQGHHRLTRKKSLFFFVGRSHSITCRPDALHTRIPCAQRNCAKLGFNHSTGVGNIGGKGVSSRTISLLCHFRRREEKIAPFVTIFFRSFCFSPQAMREIRTVARFFPSPSVAFVQGI